MQRDCTRIRFANGILGFHARRWSRQGMAAGPLTSLYASEYGDYALAVCPERTTGFLYDIKDLPSKSIPLSREAGTRGIAMSQDGELIARWNASSFTTFQPSANKSRPEPITYLASEIEGHANPQIGQGSVTCSPTSARYVRYFKIGKLSYLLAVLLSDSSLDYTILARLNGHHHEIQAAKRLAIVDATIVASCNDGFRFAIRCREPNKPKWYIKVYNLKTLKLVRSFANVGPRTGASLDMHGTHLCIHDDGFRVFCMESGSMLTSVGPFGFGDSLTTPFPGAMSSDGRFVVAPCNETTIGVYDLSSVAAALVGRLEAVSMATCAQISKSGDIVLTGGIDGVMRSYHTSLLTCIDPSPFVSKCDEMYQRLVESDAKRSPEQALAAVAQSVFSSIEPMAIKLASDSAHGDMPRDKPTTRTVFLNAARLYIVLQAAAKDWTRDYFVEAGNCSQTPPWDVDDEVEENQEVTITNTPNMHPNCSFEGEPKENPRRVGCAFKWMRKFLQDWLGATELPTGNDFVDDIMSDEYLTETFKNELPGGMEMQISETCFARCLLRLAVICSPHTLA